jgi:hypothetical protein
MTTSTTFGADALRGFTGELLTPDDPSYDTVRRIWNGSIDRRPAFIARCHTTSDVVAALRFARQHDLPLAVRGGGHSIPGYSVCEGGLMIDLQPMKQVLVYPDQRLADVEPGVLWREFDAAAQAHGLATPGGEISDTGVAGLTLGGGIGWLSRLHGLAADNLLGVTLVTATGDVVEVDDETDPELMWGLRGGGGNFGIVTRFRFRLHPVGPVYGGMVMYAGTHAAAVLNAAIDFGDAAPRETAMTMAVVSAPPAPFVPVELQGKPIVAVAAAHFGDVTDGADIVAPLRRIATPVVDTFGVTSYVDLQRMFDDANAVGMQQYVKSDFLHHLDRDAVARLVEYGTSPSSPLNQMLLRRMGGRISDIAPEDTAFGLRTAEHLFLLAGTWTDPGADATPHTEWVRGAWNALRPWSCGTYVNHLGDEGADRIREAYQAESWRRLTALKRRMDVDNVFALNQNIPPAQP